MDRSAFELGMLTPPRDRDDPDDVLQLVDEWVRQFEADTGAQWDESERSPAPPKRARVEDRPRSIAQMRSEWSRLAGGARRTDSVAEPEAPAPPTRNQPLPLKSAGLQTTFSDGLGGSISLFHVDGRLQHRGTVSVSGGGMVEAACRDIRLPGHVRRAFEFIAAWFGFPFDAVNLHRVDDRILSWGFWPFAGDVFVRCLHEWKRQEPDAFAAYCGAFGIDVTGTENGTAPSILTVRSESRQLQGRAAEWAIASEPQLLAVLARAGRNAAAQKAQVEVALANWVTPSLFQAWDAAADGERLTLDVLKSPRSIAVLLYLVRRHGHRAAIRLQRSVNERCRPNDDEEAWLSGVVRVLRHTKREHDVSEVLRIASSPELAAE
jgi:hypothetical protein